MLLQLFYKMLSLKTLFSKEKQTFWVVTIYLICILGNDFLYSNQYQDQHGLHWLVLSLINVCTALYLFTEKQYATSFNKIIKSPIIIGFTLFFAICGLSSIVAINPIETLTDLPKLFIVLLTIINASTLFSSDKKSFSIIAYLLTIVTLIQMIIVLFDIYINGTVIYRALKFTTGNKNIFAISMVVKMSFVLYTFFRAKKTSMKSIAIVTYAIMIHLVALSSARTALIASIGTLLILIVGKLIIDKKDRIKSNSINFGLLLAITVLGLFSNRTDNENTAQSRLAETSAKGDIRTEYWKNAFEIIKEHPFTGVGYGNYKLYTTNYIKYLQKDGVFSVHPHNDFVFIAAETGIPNLIIYLGIFGIAVFILAKKALTKTNENRLKYVIVGAGIFAYLVDSMFNFPHERPIMQMLLAILLACTISFSIESKNESNTSKNSFVKAILIILSFASIVLFYMVSNTQKGQSKIDTDIFSTEKNPNRPLQLTYESARSKIGWIPSISETYQTNGYKLAIYLRNEKRFDEALHMLDSVKRYHPYVSHHDELKFKIYLEDLKNNDSAYVYGRKAIEGRPKNFQLLQLYFPLLVEKQDAKSIKKLFKTFDSLSPSTKEQYRFYIESLTHTNASKDDIEKEKKLFNIRFPGKK